MAKQTLVFASSVIRCYTLDMDGFKGFLTIQELADFPGDFLFDLYAENDRYGFNQRLVENGWRFDADDVQKEMEEMIKEFCEIAKQAKTSP